MYILSIMDIHTKLMDLHIKINNYINTFMYDNENLDCGRIAGYNNCCIKEFRKVSPLDRTEEQLKARKILMKYHGLKYMYVLCKKCSSKVIKENNYNIKNYYNYELREKQYKISIEYIKLFKKRYGTDLIREINKLKKDLNEWYKREYMFLRYLSFVLQFDEYK
jgi:hypothetical protein